MMSCMQEWKGLVGGRTDLLPESEDDGQDSEPEDFGDTGHRKTPSSPSGFRAQNGSEIAVHFSVTPLEEKK